MSGPGTTPLGAVGRGLAAGVVGTAVMTAWQEVSSKLQEGGSGSGGEPGDPWEEASAPANVARRIIEGVFHREAPPEWIPALTHATHWGYGTAWGPAFGLIQGTHRARPLRNGLLFGTGVWVMSYAQLVPMGLYEPPWKYPPKQLAMDLSYHLVYGAAVGAAYATLAPGR